MPPLNMYAPVDAKSGENQILSSRFFFHSAFENPVAE